MQAQANINEQQQLTILIIFKIQNPMNINEDYGNIDMPSEIADSFQCNIPSQYQSHLITDSPHNYRPPDNLDSSLQDDTFLDNVDLLMNKQQHEPIANNQKQTDSLFISKKQISKLILPNQSTKQSIHLTNMSSQIIMVNIVEPPFEIMCHNKTNIHQLYLQPYEGVEIVMIIKKREQIGDIYENIIFQYKVLKQNHRQNPKKLYLPVQIKYIRPKLKLKYQGCSEIVNIVGNTKVSMNRIVKNKFNEYQIQIAINSGIHGMQIQRFQCEVTSRGNLSTFPKDLIFYEGEPRSIIIRQKQINCKSLGVIVLKACNSKIQFVIGIQLI